jgi:hypothetical protein
MLITGMAYQDLFTKTRGDIHGFSGKERKNQLKEPKESRKRVNSSFCLSVSERE